MYLGSKSGMELAERKPRLKSLRGDSCGDRAARTLEKTFLRRIGTYCAMCSTAVGASTSKIVSRSASSE